MDLQTMCLSCGKEIPISEFTLNFATCAECFDRDFAKWLNTGRAPTERPSNDNRKD